MFPHWVQVSALGTLDKHKLEEALFREPTRGVLDLILMMMEKGTVNSSGVMMTRCQMIKRDLPGLMMNRVQRIRRDLPGKITARLNVGEGIR